jgi:integrase
MPRSAKPPTPTHAGGFRARKVIPADVRDDYAKQHGKRTEERFNSGPMPATLARAKWREWSSDIEARIANIRAARKGEGRTLTPLAARALAGEWYGWYVAVMAGNGWPAPVWVDYQERQWSGLHVAAAAAGMISGDPVDEWEREPALREHVRPIIADEAKSQQFLAAKRMVLDPASETIFLDYVTRDFFGALALLVRRARGDHREDDYPKQFPQSVTTDPAVTAWKLFEGWIASAKPAAGTISRWRTVFLRLQADFPDAAGALLSEQMHAWANGLIDSDRSAGTVANTWVRAGRTVFAWAVDEKLVTRNPFTGWRIKVPKKRRNRETKAFTNDEIDTILRGALAITVRGKIDAAKRWGPWLAAYSGARMGEITQLRGADVIVQDGVNAMKLSPEAGTVKGGKARTVPLHGHLIDQGFLDFVKASGEGPLFYTVPKPRKVMIDPTNPRRPHSTRSRELVAAWVRQLGVRDPELSPNHAWRHTFRAMADRCGISEKMTDAIVGHAPASEGRKYGEPTLADKAAALRKFPGYK